MKLGRKLTNGDHVCTEKTLERQRDKDFESERAAEGNQTKDSDNSGGGVDGVEGNVPLLVPDNGQIVIDSVNVWRIDLHLADPRRKRQTVVAREGPDLTGSRCQRSNITGVNQDK